MKHETLRYPFGETPEREIRQRHALRVTGLYTRKFTASWPMYLHGWRTNKLITLLDSLALTRAYHTYRLNEPGADPEKGAEAQALRINILAALDIDESGGIATTTCGVCGHTEDRLPDAPCSCCHGGTIAPDGTHVPGGVEPQ